MAIASIGYHIFYLSDLAVFCLSETTAKLMHAEIPRGL
jgi:hypothetical protein